jgi:hypothetical protein
MVPYIFCERPALFDRFAVTPETIRGILMRVADGTDTEDLVVSLYLLARGASWGGHTLARAWSTPRDFFSPAWPRRRRVAFPAPGDLPARYKHIRIFFGGNLPPYPSVQVSRYGFRWRFTSFADHLAYLFSHELHHYRRDHLGLHRGEGEVSAERWAYSRLRELGFQTKYLGRVERGRRRRRPLPADVIRAHERLRAVRQGDVLVCTHPSCRRIGKDDTVRVLRPPRRGAYRLAVRTADGASWLVPLVHLRVPDGQPVSSCPSLG